MEHKAGGIAGRPQTPSRLVITEFSQIFGSLAIQNLKHVQDKFLKYPGSQSESFEKWAGIYSPANSKHDKGCAVLEPLDSEKIFR